MIKYILLFGGLTAFLSCNSGSVLTVLNCKKYFATESNGFVSTVEKNGLLYEVAYRPPVLQALYDMPEEFSEAEYNHRLQEVQSHHYFYLTIRDLGNDSAEASFDKHYQKPDSELEKYRNFNLQRAFNLKYRGARIPCVLYHRQAHFSDRADMYSIVFPFTGNFEDDVIFTFNDELLEIDLNVFFDGDKIKNAPSIKI